MDLIHFQGLNCFHDCVLSIANHFGLHYPASFASLWSETDFRYDPYREAYLTKRMISSLETMGAKVECFDCFSPKDADKYLSMFSEGEFMIVGMDAFYIPWNQFCQSFHGPHYFIVQKEKSGALPCIDPTYNKKNEQMDCDNVIAHTFDICRISKVKRNPLQAKVADEAWEILCNHSNTRQELLSRIYDCVNKERKDIILLAKYVDAMICNRYLYRFFLEHQTSFYKENNLLLSNSHFLEWTAVKNGLFKTSVSRTKEKVITDVCGHFNHIMDEEISIAEKIINTAGVSLKTV